MLISNSISVSDVHVLDPHINFSDHLPITSLIDILVDRKDISSISESTQSIHLQLRWDYAH